MSPETNRRINSPEHGANSPTNRYVETQRRIRLLVFGRIVRIHGVLELPHAAAHATHQFGNFRAAEEQYHDEYDNQQLAVSDHTGYKHSLAVFAFHNCGPRRIRAESASRTGSSAREAGSAVYWRPALRSSTRRLRNWMPAPWPSRPRWPFLLKSPGWFLPSTV